MRAAAKKAAIAEVEFDTDCWRTPPWLFAFLAEKYGPFDLDAAADAENHLAPAWFSETACELSWVEAPFTGPYRVFCNPPYSQPNLPAFMAKARDEGVKPGAVVTMVVPLTRDAPWFHESVFRGAGVIDNARLPFIGTDEDEKRRAAQSTRYDAIGCHIEVIEIEGRVKFHRPLPDGTWGPTGSPAGGTAVVTFISKSRFTKQSTTTIPEGT